MPQRSYKKAAPCASCPWRTDQRAEDIPGFQLPLAEALASTCPDEQGHGPGPEAPLFACHHSRDESEIPCAGWLAAVGHRHPRVRIAVMQGRIDPQALSPDAASPELHGNYQDVLAKLRNSSS